MDGLTIAEAAEKLGCSPHAVRRRIKNGSLTAAQVETRYGVAWRVDASLAPVSRNGDAQVAQSSRDPDTSPALIEALHLVDKLQQQNMELAGRVGYYQAQLETVREQLKMLEAPKTAEALAIVEPELRPWWRFW